MTVKRTLHENARAKLRVLSKHLLRKHGYPPKRRRRCRHTDSWGMTRLGFAPSPQAQGAVPSALCALRIGGLEDSRNGAALTP
ncbi:hypothetical protein [Chloracidobacterium validum]